MNLFYYIIYNFISVYLIILFISSGERDRENFQVQLGEVQNIYIIHSRKKIVIIQPLRNNSLDMRNELNCIDDGLTGNKA